VSREMCATANALYLFKCHGKKNGKNLKRWVWRHNR